MVCNFKVGFWLNLKKFQMIQISTPKIGSIQIRIGHAYRTAAAGAVVWPPPWVVEMPLLTRWPLLSNNQVDLN